MLWEHLLTSRVLPSDSISELKAEPDKLWYQKTRTWYSIYQFTIVSLFKLAIMTQLSIFVLIQRHKRRHLKSATSSWPDKGTCREIDNVYQATCNNAVYMRCNWLAHYQNSLPWRNNLDPRMVLSLICTCDVLLNCLADITHILL